MEILNEIKNILFRADSSSTIGTGHIMRDLVLAKQYSDANIVFATQELEGNINHKIIEAGYKIKILKSNDIEELDKLIKKYNTDMLVIDHYGIDHTFEKQVKNQNPKLKILSFDDTYEKHHCDILLNHNISGDEKKYKNLVPKDCELRCGSKYTLLRDEFIKEKKKLKDKTTTTKAHPLTSIFIAMGGADHSNINIKVLEVLKKFKNVKVNLVTTTANKNLEELKSYCKNQDWINLYINSNKIAKLMSKSDFAIVTPSVTVNEVYYMELPMIAIMTADNQIDMYGYLKKRKYFVLKEFDEEKLDKYINKMVKTYEKDVELINFIDLSLEKKKVILSWRNHPNIKKWMYTQDDITLDQHLSFIETLKENKSKKYFLAKKDNDGIGVICFTDLDKKEIYFGFYANPTVKIHGIGRILEQISIDYAFNTLKVNKLKLEVFDENMQIRNLHKKYNFKETSKKYVNNKEVICMELNNENR